MIAAGMSKPKNIATRRIIFLFGATGPVQWGSLEVGAVAGAVRADAVRRESPAPGDIVLMFGGRTGRDGVGGATGSSKEHNVMSIETCSSEVQKGNAPEERKLERLLFVLRYISLWVGSCV